MPVVSSQIHLFEKPFLYTQHGMVSSFGLSFEKNSLQQSSALRDRIFILILVAIATSDASVFRLFRRFAASENR